MKDNVLVTGGSGLVGCTINSPFKPSSTYLNLMHIDDIVRYITLNNINSIIHCAGKVGGLKANSDKLGEFFYKNIIINTNILEAARICNVKKVVSFMSTCVFPNKVEYPLKEECIHKGEPHSSNYAYAYAKRMVDVQSRAYRDQYGCNFVTLVPCNIYGPNDNYDLNDSHVIPALIHKCYLAKRDNTDFVIWGSGKPMREFLYSEDVGKIALMALESYNEKSPMILSSSDEVSISEIVDIIVDIMNFSGKVLYESDRLEGQHRKPASNEKFKTHYSDFRFTPLREGLEKSIEWFIKNYEKARK
jgi:GDP-L-fucose synthase|tara:strand:- start:7505 stop:8413 length:909 start_codon:yes stop_codon:yes gene_type:complete